MTSPRSAAESEAGTSGAIDNGGNSSETQVRAEVEFYLDSEGIEKVTTEVPRGVGMELIDAFTSMLGSREYDHDYGSWDRPGFSVGYTLEEDGSADFRLTRGSKAPWICFDANCFIDACDGHSDRGAAVRSLLQRHFGGSLRATISRHTLLELTAGEERYGSQALELAQECDLIQYNPIGSINDLVGTIASLPGSFDDWGVHAQIENEISRLLKRGADIRDKGALLDALVAGADIFCTNDRHIAWAPVAESVRESFGIRVLTPLDAEAFIAAILPGDTIHQPSTPAMREFFSSFDS